MNCLSPKIFVENAGPDEVKLNDEIKWSENGMKTLEISVQPLTPILTGGANRTTDRLHETGIIGSLRWWYEAIVRGIGGSACDPTKTKCRYDEVLCDVCQVFGATGWKRRFDMRIVRDETGPAWTGTDLRIIPPGRSHGWFLPAGRVGKFTLKIRGDSEIVGILASLLLFLEKRGAMGAKPQLGYGFFKIVNRSEVSKCAKKWEIMGSNNERPDVPDLRHWFFFKFRFKPSHPDWWMRIGGLQRLLGNRKDASVVSHLAELGMVPVSPVLKNRWRFVEWDAPFPAKRWLFGSSTGEDRLRSRVSVSWAYREGGVWVVRGWASIPEEERTKSGVFQHRQDIDLLEKTPKTICPHHQPPFQHRQDIDLLEKMLNDETIWKKALNLDYTTPTDLNVDRLTDKDIIRFMEG
ncbi:MAG: type III-B CRISPR module RAMP protein Cmr1 [Candidatus Methanogaster sp.]|uniref:Type III-B CRISPR module RAMP protein Cmr1 n=1 Tax=Candidatus Methanogaster sp. TaxID=3386292 RepID=A0AC61L0R9_9EURY|nr:MAG: type III-B CRISPR module RAMP protein Cmr1 [ANME-2 cluster archaeon]